METNPRCELVKLFKVQIADISFGDTQQLSLTLRSRVFYCSARFRHLYYSPRWDQTKYKLLVDVTALGRFNTATESGANIKADILRVLGKNPRGKNSKEVITGSEFFAS